MINRIIRAIAGTFVILSVLLGMYVNENWFGSRFCGANLLQSSFTKWCLMEDILRKVFRLRIKSESGESLAFLFLIISKYHFATFQLYLIFALH
jgi:hypothetical protein